MYSYTEMVLLSFSRTHTYRKCFNINSSKLWIYLTISYYFYLVTKHLQTYQQNNLHFNEIISYCYYNYFHQCNNNDDSSASSKTFVNVQNFYRLHYGGLMHISQCPTYHHNYFVFQQVFVTLQENIIRFGTVFQSTCSKIIQLQAIWAMA